MLVGSVTVSEWMTPDGDRYLRYTTDDNLPIWTVRGWLNDADEHYQDMRWGDD